MGQLDNSVNFNMIENQDRCIYRERFYKAPPHYYRRMIIQYFIHIRNYGWTRYNGVLYNLNKHEQGDAFIEVLLKEGFIEQVGNLYTVLDSNYINFVNLPRFNLIFELAIVKGNALSMDECAKIDKAALKKMNKKKDLNETKGD